MCKLATIGAMIAALAIPATAGAHGTAGRHDRGQIAGLPRAWSSCPNAATPCAAAGLVRNPQTGQVKAIPFWRLQRLNDPNGDHP